MTQSVLYYKYVLRNLGTYRPENGSMSVRPFPNKFNF